MIWKLLVGLKTRPHLKIKTTVVILLLLLQFETTYFSYEHLFHFISDQWLLGSELNGI